jgi:hypothetical protein
MIGLFTKSIAADSTKFALMAHLCKSNAWPTFIDEYRATNDNVKILQRLLREMYDHGRESRGRADQTLTDYELVSPAVVCGENPFTDAANAERSISLKLDKVQIKRDTVHYEAFRDLLEIPPVAFRAFAHKYITWTLSKDADELRVMHKRAEMRFRECSDSPRVVANFAVAWVGLSLLREFVEYQGWDVEIFQEEEAFVDALRYTYLPGLGVRTLCDSVCEEISHTWHVHDLGTEWDENTGTLWFNLIKAKRILHLSNRVVEMLEVQLEERSSTYIVGPRRRTGNAMYWGIKIDKAQGLGLNVFKPDYDPGNLEVRIETKKNGNAKI